MIMDIEKHIQDVNNSLQKYISEIKRLNDAHKSLFTGEEVSTLLSTQRCNSYVAVLKASGYNKEIASAANTAPEPGGDKTQACHWNRRNTT
jgi:hypothetical protein